MNAEAERKTTKARRNPGLFHLRSQRKNKNSTSIKTMRMGQIQKDGVAGLDILDLDVLDSLGADTGTRKRAFSTYPDFSLSLSL